MQLATVQSGGTSVYSPNLHCNLKWSALHFWPALAQLRGQPASEWWPSMRAPTVLCAERWSVECICACCGSLAFFLSLSVPSAGLQLQAAGLGCRLWHQLAAVHAVHANLQSCAVCCGQQLLSQHTSWSYYNNHFPQSFPPKLQCHLRGFLSIVEKLCSSHMWDIRCLEFRAVTSPAEAEATRLLHGGDAVLVCAFLPGNE